MAAVYRLGHRRRSYQHATGADPGPTGRLEGFQDLGAEVIDIGAPDVIVLEAVFATPTYMLNNRIVSLGNPSPVEVAGWAREAMVKPIRAG